MGPIELSYETFLDRVKIPVEVGLYPNNEPYVKCNFEDDIMDEADEFRLTVRPYTMMDFYTAMMFADTLRWRGILDIDLFLPLVPGSRQDRLNIMDSGADTLFTLKSVAEAINQRNFRVVVVLDPHSDVTPGLIDRCGPITADMIISRNMQHMPDDYTCIIAPDAGAAKRAAGVAKLWNIPVVQAWKTRSPQTGALTGFGIEPVASEAMLRPLVVDDLCDGGGTFAGLANKIDEEYATDRIDLYVTHGLFTKGIKPLVAFDTIYTTNSYTSHGLVADKLRVFNVV